MTDTFRGLLLAFALLASCWIASGQPQAEVVPQRALTLLVESEIPVPVGLQIQVERSLAESSLPGGERIDWSLATKSDTEREFQDLVILTVHGVCRLPSHSQSEVSAQALGWVERVDGQILAAIHIDCPRIGEAVSRAIAPGSFEAQAAYARAISRVIRHELNHVLLNTALHDVAGDNKRALTAAELAAP
jgi:hypothetical protein